MAKRNETAGAAEIRAALSESRRLFASIGLFSAFVNLLMLTGPIFMLQIYDRVLTSRSEATLVALVVIVAFLFLMMGLLDHARARVLARAGAKFQAKLDPRVLGAILTRAGRSPAARSAPATGLHDLEAMQRFASGPGPFAFFDAPWTPVFLCVLFVFHWMMGLLAVASGVILLTLALLNQARTSALQRESGEATARAAHFVERLRAGGETVRGLGMREAVLARTAELRTVALSKTVAASDRGGAFTVTTRTLRLFLQSMMLGLGAWLALPGEVTPGIMIAASILLGRALAPIDQAVAQWPVLQRALAARRSLVELLATTPQEPAHTPLPRPSAVLEAGLVVVAAPGAAAPAVRGVSLTVHPGEAVGISGPSASGKSTLARALAGVWPPAAGKVTLGGAELDQYGEIGLASHIGWLPQEVVLFVGTVAENIARLEREPDPEAVIRAARQAGAHEMILSLPGGYDFDVSAGGAALSGGQRQRIALARAFYGNPVVMVLDEPDAHLDAAGRLALNRAVAQFKARGGAAVIVAHHFSTFAECDDVYRMENGQMQRIESDNRAELSGPGSARGASDEAPVRAVTRPPGLRTGTNRATARRSPVRTVAGPPGALKPDAPARARASPVRVIRAAPPWTGTERPPDGGTTENDT